MYVLFDGTGLGMGNWRFGIVEFLLYHNDLQEICMLVCRNIGISYRL